MKMIGKITITYYRGDYPSYRQEYHFRYNLCRAIEVILNKLSHQEDNWIPSNPNDRDSIK